MPLLFCGILSLKWLNDCVDILEIFVNLKVCLQCASVADRRAMAIGVDQVEHVSTECHEIRGTC